MIKKINTAQFFILFMSIGCFAIDAKEMSVSEQIFSSYLTQSALPNTSNANHSLSSQEARHIQTEYCRLRHPIDPIMGFGGELFHALFQAEALQTPAHLSLKNSNPFFQQSLETKFGFYLKNTLNRPIYHIQDLKMLVEYVTPVVEMTHFYYASAPSPVDLIAANGGYRAWIVGNKVPVEGLALNDIDVVLRVNNSPLYSGKGRDAMGDQWQALMTLINEAIEQGWVLEPHQVLVTNRIGKNVAPQVGVYRMEFGILGPIELDITH